MSSDRAAFLAELLLILASMTFLYAGLTRTEIGRWRFAALAAITLLVGPLFVVAAFVARRLRLWPPAGKVGVALALLAAITFAQPFGMRVESIETPGAELYAAAELDPTATQSADLLGLPVLDFELYRLDITGGLAALGECCPPTHEVKARSHVLPGLLMTSSDVVDVCGDEPCWGPDDPYLSVREVSGEWYALLDDPSKIVRAWKLSAGVASTSGVMFWVIAGVAILVLIGRRRVPSSAGAVPGRA